MALTQREVHHGKAGGCPYPASKVYLFGTCLVDAVYPDAGMAAIRLLESQGAEVIFPAGQSRAAASRPTIPGLPEARAVARKQIQVFSKPYPVVVPSGSCAGMMKHHYPALFAGTADEDAARRFSDRVFELSEYLDKVLAVEA
jgi:L-lactate dehydrogenase complex protein LldE